MQNFANETRIREFAEGYMEKLFYFCLKKMGDSHEAEDLTSDISLHIVSALAKGTVPMHFSAWVWKIARNRYSVWAQKKHARLYSVAGADVGECEIEDIDSNVEDAWIHDEELSLLRRELAFISSAYRNILVAHYIEDRSVKDIAASLGLPEGTVKSRLSRARNILKEGIGMAREFGALSYKPEDIRFIRNGMWGKYGEPQCYLKRALCKNIMLATYRTPSTAEALAIELGVALPYMEDELRELTEATLLRKNGNKYETNFFIISAETQRKMYAYLRELTPELTKAIMAAREYWIQCHTENKTVWCAGDQSYEDMKWALLMWTVDIVNHQVIDYANRKRGAVVPDNIGKWGHIKRPNGGEWDIVGFENYPEDVPSGVGLSGCVDTPEAMEYEQIDFRHFLFQYRGIAEKAPMHLQYNEGKALLQVAKGETEKADKNILERLFAYGFLHKDGDTYQPAFCVMFKDKIHTRTKEQDAEYNQLLHAASRVAYRFYEFCSSIIHEEIPDFLQDDAYQIDQACVNMLYHARGAVLEEALRIGYITYTDDDTQKMLGVYMIV